MALISVVAIISTNTLHRPLSWWVNHSTQHAMPGSRDPENQDSSTDYVLEVVTTDKSEQRVRALLLQPVDRPEYTLRAFRPGKSPQMRPPCRGIGRTRRRHRPVATRGAAHQSGPETDLEPVVAS
ncbi:MULTISPECIES: hypothetical protein [Streptomyces]|uniref:Uncharacterized protein n=1 Tax=Streptomyces yatensis TaxID=155177 RepID=A0ABN2JNB1_9ACTN|nr:MULTISPECIES: hypothetical protein [Streptomyces]MCG0284090.1 hypothetical protein [Streptomyces sp. PSAA01]